MHMSTPIGELKRNYHDVRKLMSINRNENAITLDYSKLDSVTVGMLKYVISKTIANAYESEYYKISESEKKVLDDIVKQNTGSSKVTIDYDKIETYQIRFSIKGQIQNVLKTRAGGIYKDMLMNTY